jgi:5-methylcytosine-specific restriction endonuclease McrA
MDVATRQLVRERAAERCEYCRLPEQFDEWPFHVDHIIALVHGGGDDPANLSWACTQCNVHKGTNFVSIDSETGQHVHLFNPRDDTWRDHFTLGADDHLVGKTPTGRATARLLDMNGTPQLDLRRELVQRGEFSID